MITRGLAELTRLGVAMGAEPQTLAGLAGMGDLVATCMSPYSRNRTVGELLGRGKPLEEILADMHMVAEGVGTARIALSLAERYHVELPICEEIHKVVHGRAATGRRLPGPAHRRPRGRPGLGTRGNDRPARPPGRRRSGRGRVSGRNGSVRRR